jgi:hypothetical protein
MGGEGKVADGNSYLFPPTDDSYVTACKKRNFTPNSVVLQDGTRAHWVGSSKAAKVIINFHGMCFVGCIVEADSNELQEEDTYFPLMRLITSSCSRSWMP